MFTIFGFFILGYIDDKNQISPLKNFNNFFSIILNITSRSKFNSQKFGI